VSSGQNDDWLQPSKGEAPFSGLSGNANATYSINKPLSHRSYEYLQAMEPQVSSLPTRTEISIVALLSRYI